MPRLSLVEVIDAALVEMGLGSDDRSRSNSDLRELGLNPDVIVALAEEYVTTSLQAGRGMTLGDFCTMFEIGWRARMIWERK